MMKMMLTCTLIVLCQNLKKINVIQKSEPSDNMWFALRLETFTNVQDALPLSLLLTPQRDGTKGLFYRNYTKER